MKIALIGPGILPIPPNGYGAVEKHIWHLGNQLRARGHDVTVLNELDGEYAWGIKVGRLLRHTKFDIVHAHTSFMGGYLARFKLETEERLVYTSHSPLWFARDPGPKERWGMLWEVAAIKFAPAVIALTPEQASKFEKYRAFADVVPNGVDCQQFQPNWEARTGKRVCMLGKVTERKRVHVVAEAMAEIGPAAEFHVIGPTPDRQYAQLIQKLNPSTTFHSNLDEAQLAGYLASMDVFVHASEAEAMSIAVLEAMACGLPIVYTKSSASVVGPETGIQVCDEDDATDYQACIEQLLSNQTLQGFMGMKARERAVQHFDWSRVAKEVEGVYASVADVPS